MYGKVNTWDHVISKRTQYIWWRIQRFLFFEIQTSLRGEYCGLLAVTGTSRWEQQETHIC